MPKEPRRHDSLPGLFVYRSVRIDTWSTTKNQTRLRAREISKSVKFLAEIYGVTVSTRHHILSFFNKNEGNISRIKMKKILAYFKKKVVPLRSVWLVSGELEKSIY